MVISGQPYHVWEVKTNLPWPWWKWNLFLLQFVDKFTWSECASSNQLSYRLLQKLCTFGADSWGSNRILSVFLSNVQFLKFWSFSVSVICDHICCMNVCVWACACTNALIQVFVCLCLCVYDLLTHFFPLDSVIYFCVCLYLTPRWRMFCGGIFSPKPLSSWTQFWWLWERKMRRWHFCMSFITPVCSTYGGGRLCSFLVECVSWILWHSFIWTHASTYLSIHHYFKQFHACT